MRRSIKRIIAISLATVMAIGLTACGSSDSDKSYERVVALTQSVASMWLLAGGKIIGTTDDEYQKLQTEGSDMSVVTSVGSVDNVDADAVITLKPDIVLVPTNIANYKELKSAFDEASVEIKDVTVTNFSTYANAMMNFSQMTGNSQAYEKNVTQIAKSINSMKLETRLSGSFLALQLSNDETTVLKGDNFVVDMATDLGMKSVATDDTSVKADVDELVKLNPSTIFLIYDGDSATASQLYKDNLASKDGWNDIKAVKDGKVYILPSDMFVLQPNEKWGKAYAYLYDIVTGVSPATTP